MKNPYQDFIKRFSRLIAKNPELIIMALSNIFTMRLIGNKTHGDLAEIAISEFINQYMHDFSSVHVGKDLFRAKSREEDIIVTNRKSKVEIPVSLKAYGVGPLQLSTDKSSSMFSILNKEDSTIIDNSKKIADIFKRSAFSKITDINVMPLIYDEKNKKCNILIFNYPLAKKNTSRIIKLLPDKNRRRGNRKHPVFRFLDNNGEYICEVRYGDASANALQRGLWTHTKNAINYFDSVTNGWIEYSHNLVLIKMFSHALISSGQGHDAAFAEIVEDIKRIKKVL